MGKLEKKITDSKVYIAGHKGMVGSAIFRKLNSQGFKKILTKDRLELDLTDYKAVESFFETDRPDIVIIAAAKVGGIQANIDNPVDFLLDNLSIQNNLIQNAVNFGAKKIIFLSSSGFVFRKPSGLLLLVPSPW